VDAYLPPSGQINRPRGNPVIRIVICAIILDHAVLIMANVPYPKAIFTTIIGWRVSVLINDICYKLLKKICKGSAIDNFVIRVIQL